MQLYLSSNGLGADPTSLVARSPHAHAFVVLNALDPFDGSRSNALAMEARELASLGYAIDELDLRDYFADHAGLAARLAHAQLVWVAGGNTFVLARAMGASGFPKAIDEPLHAGTLVYAGYSAGAVVAGVDLAGIEVMDDPRPVPPGYPADVLPQALGLIDERVIPHWRSGHAESAAAEHAAGALASRGLAHRCLRDGEALVVREEERRVVGSPYC